MAMLMSTVRKRLLLLGSFVASVVLVSFLMCRYLAEQHALAPSAAEKKRWAAAVATTKTIVLTKIKDAKTIVIGPGDKRFSVIIERTIHSIESESFYPNSLSPQCVVIYRSEGVPIVAVDTMKLMIIHGHYFFTPYPFLELFD